MRSRRALLYACLVCIAFCPLASAQKIKVDYDRGIQFEQYKTYSWAELPPAQYPILALSIIGSIDHELAAKGLTKVDKGGDLIVNYTGHIVGESNQPMTMPTYPGYAGPAPSINTTMWSTSLAGGGVPVTVPKGTLLVELMDPRQSRIAWRATGKVTLDIEKKTDSIARVNGMIAKMFERYPPRQK